MNKLRFFATHIVIALIGITSASAWSNEPLTGLAPDQPATTSVTASDALMGRLDEAYAEIEQLRVKLLNSLETEVTLYQKITELTAERDRLYANLVKRNEQLAALRIDRQTDSAPVAEKSAAAVEDSVETDSVEVAALQTAEPDDTALDLDAVKFRYDSHDLTADAKRILDRVAGVIREHPELHLEVAGHTDAQGDPTYNQWLSLKRAEAVRDYIVAQGVNPQRIGASGYGGEQPIADNTTREGLRKNRRVELRRLK